VVHWRGDDPALLFERRFTVDSRSVCTHRGGGSQSPNDKQCAGIYTSQNDLAAVIGARDDATLLVRFDAVTP
jgi:hypothetical protein